MNSVRKGKIGELELGHLLQNKGYKSARRSQQFCGLQTADIHCEELSRLHIECKSARRLSIHDALGQAVRDSAGSNKIPVVAWKKNRCSFVIILELESFLEILRYCDLEALNGAAERGHGTVTAPAKAWRHETNCPHLELTKLFMRCGPRARREFLSDVLASDPALWAEVNMSGTT